MRKINAAEAGIAAAALILYYYKREVFVSLVVIALIK